MTQDLIERLEEAESGSREFDVDVTVALGLWVPPKGAERTSAGVWKRGSFNHYCQHSPVTTSLDATLALAERVLPGFRVRLDLDERKRCFLYEAGVYTIGAMRGEWKHYADASTPALALCIALLRAHREGEGLGGDDRDELDMADDAAFDDWMERGRD